MSTFSFTKFIALLLAQYCRTALLLLGMYDTHLLINYSIFLVLCVLYTLAATTWRQDWPTLITDCHSFPEMLHEIDGSWFGREVLISYAFMGVVDGPFHQLWSLCYEKDTCTIAALGLSHSLLQLSYSLELVEKLTVVGWERETQLNCGIIKERVQINYVCILGL